MHDLFWKYLPLQLCRATPIQRQLSREKSLAILRKEPLPLRETSKKKSMQKHSASRLSDDWFALVHKPVDIGKAKQIPKAKAALDKELEKLESKPAWKLSSVRLKNDVIAEANKTGVKIHLGTLMSSCHLKNAQLGE